MEAGAGGAAWARRRAPPPAFAAALAAALLLSCTSPHAFLAATDLAGSTYPCEKSGLCGRRAFMRPERLVGRGGPELGAA